MLQMTWHRGQTQMTLVTRTALESEYSVLHLNDASFWEAAAKRHVQREGARRYAFSANIAQP